MQQWFPQTQCSRFTSTPPNHSYQNVSEKNSLSFGTRLIMVIVGNLFIKGLRSRQRPPPQRRIFSNCDFKCSYQELLQNSTLEQGVELEIHRSSWEIIKMLYNMKLWHRAPNTLLGRDLLCIGYVAVQVTGSSAFFAVSSPFGVRFVWPR